MRRRTIGALVVAVTVVMGGISAAAAVDPVPLPPGSIGVIGCSNTDQHVDAYLAASEVDQLAGPMNLGGGVLDRWYTDDRGHWSIFDEHRPATGYAAVWVQLCIWDAGSVAMTTHQTQLAFVIAEVRRRAGTVPIYVSPLNTYANGHVCPTTGPDAPAVASALSSWADTTFSKVGKGPVTGPLTAEMIRLDGCHLSGAGRRFVGDQLVHWFDVIGPPSVEDDPSTTTTTIDPRCVKRWRPICDN
jgi:hypothetical protein